MGFRFVFQHGGIPLVAITCGLLAGCWPNSDPEVDRPSSQAIPGMKTIHSKGKTFLQGEPAGTVPEHGVSSMETRFSYDFSMDTTEVTQESFRRLAGHNPISLSSPFGVGDTHPVYNVSWFDAVLYCNARSKKAELDTVYTYSRLRQEAGGSVYDLAGVSIHLDKRGFRLPTEAEWEFAAHAGFASEFPWGKAADSALAKNFAWFSGNAKGTSHPVASLKPNGFGVYDLAGNVMEWVNDWKGPYPNSATVDFVGARDPGIEFDIPVKGGAFKYGLNELRPANRSATYTTIRSALAEYVGFRCVVGAISKPQFSSSDGSLTHTDAVQLDLSNIQNLIGRKPAKLIFVNATSEVRHLAYVDYRKSPLRVQEFGDVPKVFYPVISPNGAWVAFGTAVEGAATGSTLYIRNLDDSSSVSREIGPGFIPRWWVDPTNRDTFLVYTNSATDNTQAQWNSSQTLLQKILGGKPMGAPSVLAEGGYHDGRSHDGRWLATGFRYLKVRDGATNKSLILFTAPGNGKAAGDTSQVCNVSIAPDSSGRTLFLDFGYEEKSFLTGSFYDIHQVAFMADTEGKVLHWFNAPKEEKGWEDLEWSNRVDFAVSSSTDPLEGHHHLYLLNLKDSVTTRLATGTQLSTPGLWLGEGPEILPGSDIDADSAGQYNDPETSVARQVFANKMHLFWKTHQDMRAAFVGSSQMTDGLDPAEITSVKSYNLAYGGGDLAGTDFMVRNYILPNCPKLELIGISIPLGWFQNPNGDVSWSAAVTGSKGLRYDENHEFWKSGLPAGFRELAVSAPYPDLGIDSLGLYGFPSGGWGVQFEEYSGTAWDVSDSGYQSSFNLFEKLITDLSSRKIHSLFLIFPQNPAYGAMLSFNVLGPDWNTAKAIITQLSALQAKYPYFHFLEMNQDGKHGYPDADAFDSIHLSRSGAKKFSAALNVEIGKILNP